MSGRGGPRRSPVGDRGRGLRGALSRVTRSSAAGVAGAALFWCATVALAAALVWWLKRHVADAQPDALTFVWRDQTVRLLEPRALLLAGLLPLVPMAAWFTRTDYGWPQRLFHVVMRWAVLLALIAAAARPSVSRFDTRMCAVYAVDVSSSVPDEVLVAARDVVQRGYDARGTGLVRLVTFAERPVVVDLVDGAGQVPALERHADGLATDAAAALRLAYGLCPEDHVQRVVLVSDGLENRGDLLAEAATAADFGVEVHTVELPFDPPAEVLVRDMRLPDVIEVSAPFTLVAELYSNRATTVRVDLRQNGFVDIRGREVQLEVGVNRVELPAEVYEPGFRRFELTVHPTEADRFDGNNHFVRTVTVRGRPRVLYVEGVPRSRGYLERALSRERNELANFDVEVRTAFGFPSTVEELINFDMVILSDVAAADISRGAMRAVETYVRDHGGAFMLVGGENSFGPGGYDNTVFEEIAPVSFDMFRERNQPALAIMLVIDRSGSMDGVKLEMAKEAARAVVDLLAPQDSIGVIAFDTEPDMVVRLQNVSNRARIRADIGRVAPGGGTDVLPAMAEAYAELVGRAARLKHMIVLTDGVAPWDGIADLTSAIRADGITVSSVAVGADADRALLEMIAELGGGRFHATNDPNNVPQIFVQETSTVARTNLVEEPFRAVVAQRSQSIRGIDWATSPYLLGYVQTQAKPRAEVILRTERGDPLLARWRLGLGRVAVFTSDCKNRWAVEWVRERIFPQFWAQVIRDMMRVDVEEELAMTTSVRGGVATLRVDAIDASDRFINGLESQVEVTRPDGTTARVALEQVAAGRYEARYPLPAYGPYQLRAEHVLGGRPFATSLGAVSYPFPDELLTTGPDASLGRRVAALTGGEVDPTPERLWDPRGRQVESRQEFWPQCLFAALALFVADLLFRRIRFMSRAPVAWHRARSGR